MQSSLGAEAAAHLTDTMPAGRPIPRDPEALLFTSEAAFLIGLSARKLEQMRVAGGGPPFLKVTKRALRYRRCDLVKWCERQTRCSTSDRGQAA